MTAPHRLNIVFHSGSFIDAINIGGSTNVLTINGDRQVFIDQPNVIDWHGNGSAIKIEGERADVCMMGISGQRIYGLNGAKSQYIAGNCRNFRYTINELVDVSRNGQEHAIYLNARNSNVGSGGRAINCGSLVQNNSRYFGSDGALVSLNDVEIIGRPPIDWGNGQFSGPILYKSQDSDVVQVRGLRVSGDITGSLYTGHWGGVQRFADNDYSGCVMVRKNFRSWLNVGEMDWQIHSQDGELGSKGPADALSHD